MSDDTGEEGGEWGKTRDALLLVGATIVFVGGLMVLGLLVQFGVPKTDFGWTVAAIGTIFTIGVIVFYSTKSD